MTYLYDTIVYYPILNALVFLYQTAAFQDLGVAIILVTLLIRLVLYPVFHKSTKHQMIAQKLQPELERITKEHKNNKEKQVEKTMALWRAHGTNPFSGVALTVVQIPVLIALYQIFVQSVSSATLEGLYSFVVPPADGLHKMFLGLLALDKQSKLMVGAAALAQYLQARAAAPPATAGSSRSGALARNMALVGPVITAVLFIALKLPDAVSLYWTVTTVATIAQQAIVKKHLAQNDHGKLGDIHQNTR